MDKLSLACTRFVANHRITILIDFYMRHFCSHQAFIPMICVPESTANVWVLTVKKRNKDHEGFGCYRHLQIVNTLQGFSSTSKRPASGSLAEKPTENPSLHSFFLKRASRRVNSCPWLLSLQKNSELLIFRQPHKARHYGSFFNMHRIVE